MPAPIQQQRRIVGAAIAVSILVGLALWHALLRYLPAPETLQPLQTAIGCIAVTALLTLLAGIQAVAHERMVTGAIDPFAGIESRWMRVNFRYLSNTVEQFIVFAAGLLAVAAYTSAKVLIIITTVWVLSRWAFWIGYQKDSLLRAVGAPGMLQSLLVLLYTAYCFGRDTYGWALGIALLATFAIIEMILFWAALRSE
jgi:hypothetical protein